MGVSINLYMLMKETFPMMHAHLLPRTITLCNFNPFTFYLPFKTSPCVDQCPFPPALWAWIRAPATHFWEHGSLIH